MVNILVILAIISTVLVVGCASPNDGRRGNGNDDERRAYTAARGRRVSTADDAMRFLKRYHWLDEMPTDTSAFTADEHHQMPAHVTQAVRNYQKHNGLSQTGGLDAETMEVMSQPRCGLPDDGMMERGRGRRRRYALQGSKWPKTSLTYIFDNYTPDLPAAQTDRTIRRAFDVFSTVTPLRFTQVRRGPADINIRFVSGDHGDGSRFDGQGRILAHAYYPQFGGDAHFDEDETWTIGSYNGINLFQVAAHEFGHSLGLSHSDVRSALMYPSYRGYQPNFQLDSDDITGIQALYGPYTGNNPPPTTTTTSRPPTSPTYTTTTSTFRPASDAASACDVAKWDAVLTTRDRNVYFFAGSQYYRKGSPLARSIAADWGMSGPINAAFTVSSGYSVLFQGNVFRVFVNNRPSDSHFRHTHYYFPAIPENPDSTWLYDDSFVMATRGSRFWAEGTHYLNKDLNRVFRGAPDFIDAATSVNGNPYLFRGQYYYVFSNWRLIGGPKSTARDFFGCPRDISEKERYFANLMQLETEPAYSEFEVEIKDKKDIRLEEFEVKLNDEAGKVVDTDGTEISSARACATWGVLTPIALALYWL